ncbi:ABC transporter ATP-binding protein [Algoriphagus machipongonensis]|uniref:Iron compound ABC transporter, ATP-binding protein n=1 Tax=Algoriphagus machipongonensis TaxID=388413 RepID=A3HWL9_9BACT|nr:ABC transporter ATP-binding protein [Algoriphagus machipongonensis]EAZ80992.1 iron compound ABC transporter, ATP-binding protein [Algoriphagus machipongonensis]
MKKAVIIGRDLSLGYPKGDTQKLILEGLDFELNAGELTCLLGPNGVGKSTLIKGILGDLPAWKGELTIQGTNVSNIPNLELAKKLSVVLTEPTFPGNMTVSQLVSLGRTPHTGWSGKLDKTDKEQVEKALDLTKIGYLKDERITEISDGQRQKAMIARALAQDGEIMILDEPTAHLDLVNRYEIMHLLQEICHQEQKAILVVTHDLEIALETADRFWLLNCGIPLISGLPEELVLSGKINSLLPGDKFHFDPEKGKIEKKALPPSWEIIGDPSSVFWIQKALLKRQIPSLDQVIEVKNTPFQIKFNGKIFDSLESFFENLKI